MLDQAAATDKHAFVVDNASDAKAVVNFDAGGSPKRMFRSWATATKTCVHEALHDVGQEAATNPGSVYQANELGLGTRRQGGTMDHDADSVVGGAIHLHGPKMDLARFLSGQKSYAMK
jgi:hypothetical protein